MFIRKDITDVNPNELVDYMENDLIFTSVGELVRGDKNEVNPWDIDLFDPVPNRSDETIQVNKKVVNVDGVWGDDIFHGDNVEWW